MHLKLEHAKDNFSIFCANALLKPKVSAFLNLLAVKVHSETIDYHVDMLRKGDPAEYPYHRIEMDVMTIKEGTQGEKKDLLFGGGVPKYVIMVMVANSSMNGDYKKNPYNFKFFNANFIELTSYTLP